MKHPARTLLLAAAGLLAGACGGGGAEGGPPEAPGVLRAVAIQGLAAPGTAGVYGAFPPHPHMDTHASGWAAFVAPTSDPAKPEVLSAMAPDGTVVPVYAVGDAAPDLADGTLAGFGGVWVGDGFLLAHVTLAGNATGRTFGIVSASLAPGGATNRIGVLYDQDALPDVAETAGGVDAATPVVEVDGTIWLRVQGATSGDWHLYSVERDGTGLSTRAQSGGALPFGVAIAALEAFSVDPTGTFYAFVAATTGADRRIYLRRTSQPTPTEVMREGDAIPGSLDSIADVHTTGTLSVYDDGRVVWMARATGPAPSDVFLTGDTAGAIDVIPLARSGDAAPLSGTGRFGALGGLSLRPSAGIPQFSAAVTGSDMGVTFGTYGLVRAPPPVLATDDISLTTAGTMGPVYVGIAPAGRAYREVSRDGSFLFANVLRDGPSAVLWLIPGDRIYALAVQGQGSPGGDMFGSFAATSAHTVDDGVALFRAPLAVSGSGLFRRGP